MNTTIGQRIAIGFFIPLILLVTVGVVSFRAMNASARALERRQHSFLVLSRLDRLNLDVVDVETGQRGYVLTGDATYLDPYTEGLERIAEDKRELRALTADNPVETERLARLETPLSAKLSELALTVALRRDNGFDAAIAVVKNNSGKGFMDQMRTVLAEMAAEENRLLIERQSDADAKLDAARVQTVTICFGAFVVVLIASFVIARSITGPLDALVLGAVRFGEGALTYRVSVQRNDETGKLAVAFNTMAERRMDADERVRASAAAREKVLATLKPGIQSLAAASRELIAGAAQQATGMQQQAAAVSETVTVVEEVSRSGQQAAERAKEVAAAARRSEEVSQSGSRAVGAVLAKIEAAKRQSDDVATKIVALAERTQTIGEIVALITDIAEQTNLLALNAAIEASRAGEHGVAFSVVAGEVKALADESKKATRRVREVLTDIQNMASVSVISTEESTRSMTSATREVAVAGETIRSFEQIVSEVAAAADQIAAATGQQALGLSQIQQAMRDVNQVSAQNLASTHQAQRAATDLSELGQRLHSVAA